MAPVHALEGAPLDEEALTALVQEVLESILSKKNLVRDQHLAGSMNPQMYIPVGRLLENERLKGVRATEQAVIVAARRSTRLGVDEAGRMVRPLLKSKRNTIILRDIPDDATEEEVRSLFVGCPGEDKLEQVRAEVNNTWFVKFHLDGTQDVVLWLRGQEFRGKPVNAAIKSDHFLRGFFTPEPNQADMAYGMSQNLADVMAAAGPPPGVPPPPPPPMMQRPPSLQSPGFWQPWGRRFQQPPLVFTSPTTPAFPSAADHRPHRGTHDEDEDEHEPKGKGSKGRGKGNQWSGNSGRWGSSGGSWWGSSGGKGGGGWWGSSGKSKGGGGYGSSAELGGGEAAGACYKAKGAGGKGLPHACCAKGGKGKWVPVASAGGSATAAMAGCAVAEDEDSRTYGKQQLLAAYQAQF